MKEFYPRNVKPVTIERQIIKLLFGGALLLISFTFHSTGGLVVSVLFLFAALLKKQVAVDDAGLRIDYDAYFFKYGEMWTYEQMTAIHKDQRRCAADEYMLHFGRDVMSRRYVFSKIDADEIIEIARRKNPRIEIGTV